MPRNRRPEIVIVRHMKRQAEPISSSDLSILPSSKCIELPPKNGCRSCTKLHLNTPNPPPLRNQDSHGHHFEKPWRQGLLRSGAGRRQRWRHPTSQCLSGHLDSFSSARSAPRSHTLLLHNCSLNSRFARTRCSQTPVCFRNAATPSASSAS